MRFTLPAGICALASAQSVPDVPRHRTLISQGWDFYNQVPSNDNFNPYAGVLLRSASGYFQRSDGRSRERCSRHKDGAHCYPIDLLLHIVLLSVHRVPEDTSCRMCASRGHVRRHRGLGDRFNR